MVIIMSYNVPTFSGFFFHVQMNFQTAHLKLIWDTLAS